MIYYNRIYNLTKFVEKGLTVLIFASLFFLYFFLPLNLIIYFFCRNIKARNLILLGFSLFFYAWGEPLWVLVLIVAAFIDYMCALYIEENYGTRKAKLGLTMSLIVNLGLLAVMKYAGFFVSSLNAILPVDLPVPSIALPLGISFYTFQTLTYVVDVYRGDVEAQHSYPNYLMYLSLYPQLVAGPIVRYSTVADEVEKRQSKPEDVAYGFFRFCVGLGKKVILANTCGAISSGFLDGNLASLTTAGAWIGVLLYSLQIYFDFAGYSDMAIGLGRIFGFHYMENFDYPYISKSVTEFWRRWHISLGSFFRDYVYIPLGGNRRHEYRNLFIVWFLTGLWHGASWNFILWGLWFGLFILLERIALKRFFAHIPKVFSHIYLILVVVIGWVFFYFTNLGDAVTVLGRMFGVGGQFRLAPMDSSRMMNYIYFFVAAVLACLPIAPTLRKMLMRRGSRTYAPGLVVLSEIIVSVVLLLVCTSLLVGESYNPFLYFRF